jgi:hypothetical protein
MSSLAMLRRSAGVTLLVHGLRAALAALLTWPLTAALQLAQDRAVYHAELGADDAALLLEVAARRAPDVALGGVGWLLAYAALSPFLSQLWLRSMLPGWRTVGLLGDALSSYLAALGVGLCWLLALAAAALVPALLLEFGAGALPASGSADSVLMAFAVCLGLGCALALVTAHDLARAALASGARRPLRAWMLGLRRLRWPELGYRALVGAGALGLVAVGEALARLWPGAAWWVLVGSQQTLLLLATALRALWLARALHQAHRLAQIVQAGDRAQWDRA